MLEFVSADVFLAHRGTEFDVRDMGDEPVVLRLAEVRVLGHQPQAPRVDPFALEFIGPSKPVLEQRTYRLGHPALGELDIFLVPIGLDPAGGVRYEAVFN